MASATHVIEAPDAAARLDVLIATTLDISRTQAATRIAEGHVLVDGRREKASYRARAGELDPLIGRTEELQRTIEILCRRRKNNPVFVGDAGVGKTALAEGLATRLLSEDVPDLLEGAEVFSLDTAALQPPPDDQPLELFKGDEPAEAA